MTKKKHHKDGRPWRDNIEAVTVSIVVIVLFKYFILEAYKIPTGSMQPTLMGWKGGVHDRVLVDKLSYHYRDPLRWEVVVFKYPLNRAKNFIKRIVGMPGEYLEIRDGDLFTAPAPDGPLSILRRPKPVLDAVLKRLESAGEWSAEGGGWRAEGRSVFGEGPGGATFPRTSAGGVRDVYTDGYPGEMVTAVVPEPRARSGANAVGDLRLTGAVTARQDCPEVRLELREGSRRYTVHLPGPAAPEGARPALRLHDPVGDVPPLSVEGEPWRLPAGSRTRFRFQNVDDLLELRAGQVELELEIPPAESQVSFVHVGATGGGVELTDLEVYRDIYYVDNHPYTRWDIPDGCYVMLGDNTQDSSDSREWSLLRYEIPDEEGVPRLVRGNQRGEENPRTGRDAEGRPLKFFHDELGELWVFDPRGEDVDYLGAEQSSFVPRELIRGRAVLVVWPFVPRLDVYRLKWVR